jgi:RNA polymerase sigma-70 factor (ECF subfamily)
MSQRTNEQWLSELTAEASAKQALALEDLRVRLYQGILYYLTRERSDLSSRSRADLEQMAEDFTQEGLLRILKNLQSFRGDSQFTTWATKVAVRVAISELRRARYRDFSLEDLTSDGEILPRMNPDFGSDHPAGPEKAAERADILRHIESAMVDTLSDRQRAALEAVALRGVPLEIVAEQMQTNRNALYKLLHDARSRLRAALERDGLSVDYIKNLFA